MATITVRGVEEALRDQLRVRAARHGRSMEAEVRAILADVVYGGVVDVVIAPPGSGIGTWMHEQLRDLEVELDISGVRDVPARAATFE